ncbi:NADH-quinone oxidoreductase subunit NuoF [bacterium]|nr:NADH-quinone oxidoreductase subunit NuoF [bacterium]
MEKILLKNIDKPNSHTIESYLNSGGYQALKKALKEYSPDQIIDMVKKSNLRGRGGAGFPTGVKWSFMPKKTDKPNYLVCNADEGEPGTFKDKVILEYDPHMLIEGMIISAYAIGARYSFIYIRGEFLIGGKLCEAAIQEAREKGFLGDNILGSGFNHDIYIHYGAGAYICGEETSLMNSIEGKRGYPRIRPPFPASYGVFGNPTTVNNVETLANVPHIIERGVEWYLSIGPDKNNGPKLLSVSGPVKRPGVYEVPMGIPLRTVIFDICGGMLPGKAIKAIIPGGSSTPMLTIEDLDVHMDFDSLVKAGSMLGSGGVIVIDDSFCIVRAATILTDFYKHESCGQCTPCREGTGWLQRIMHRIEGGQGREEDIDLLLSICKDMEGHTICPLADAAIPPIRSSIQKFRDEYLYHIKEKECMV